MKKWRAEEHLQDNLYLLGGLERLQQWKCVEELWRLGR